MNKVILCGNVSTDIDFKQTNGGTPVAKFNIAVNRAKDGTDFVPIVAWNQMAENVNQYCKKGSKILIEGRMQVNEYEQKKYTEVVADKVEFLSKAKEDNPYKDMSIRTVGKQMEIEDEDLPWK